MTSKRLNVFKILYILYPVIYAIAWKIICVVVNADKILSSQIGILFTVFVIVTMINMKQIGNSIVR